MSILINKVTAIDEGADVGSHVHSSNYGITQHQNSMDEIYDFHKQDFVIGWTKKSIKVIKNRKNGNKEIPTDELIPIVSKLLAKSFLNEKMNLFEEELAREIETAIHQTLEKG
jgi:hypothetical protein